MKLIEKRLNELAEKIHDKKIYILVYTLIFGIVSLIVFNWFIRTSRGFVWWHDGEQQHLNLLMYYGTYLRNIGWQLLRGRLDIPLWDFTFGFGADIPKTLHYYVLGDPLTVLSVFVPTRYMEYLYNFLVVFRIYLVGLVFSFYGFKLKKKPFPILIGALIYSFCGFVLFAGPRHPYFLNPLIYFPLICLGVEKIFKNEKPHLFIFMIFISLLSSFYFFYMISILLFIYALVRSFFVYDKFSFKQFMQNMVKFMSYYLIGFLMAGILALPNIGALFASDRMSISYDISLFYTMEHYRNFVFNFLSHQHVGAWIYLGYAAISVVAILYLILSIRKNKEHLQLGIGLLILTSILLFPYLGHVMHGFSYVSNRWIGGYSFLIAFIVTSTLPELIQMGKRKLAVVSLGILVYVFALILNPNVRGEMINLTFGIILLITVVVWIIVSLFRIKDYFKYMALLLVVIFNITMVAYSLYSPAVDNYVSEFRTFGDASLNLSRSGTMSVREFVSDDDFFRVEEDPFGSNHTNNAVVQTGVPGNSFFFSLANPYVNQFLDEIHHWTEWAFRYNGLDGRAMLGVLASNRYFVVRENNEAFVPYGYYADPVGQTQVFSDRNRTHLAFLNEYALPLGYTYRRYITRSQFDELSFIERQQAMMQAVLLEGRESSANIPLVFNSQVLAFEVEADGGITFESQEIVVSGRDATLTFTFEGIPNSEIYVNFNQLHFDGWANRARIHVATDDLQKSIRPATSDWSFYAGRYNFALNMGYQKEVLNQITIWFDNLGVYTFDSIEIIAQPMDNFSEMVSHLNEYTLENIVMSTNQIEGTIDLTEERILLLSIPFSQGWRAYLNGERAELMRANTMFMAIEVPEGNHQITLIYWTPLLTEGIIATIVGFVLFTSVLVYFRNKKNQQE